MHRRSGAGAAGQPRCGVQVGMGFAASMLPSRQGAAGNLKGCSWLVAKVCTCCCASEAFAESAPLLPACSTACTPLAHKEVPLRQRVKCITGALDGAAALCCLGAMLCFAGLVRAAGCCTLCPGGCAWLEARSAARNPPADLQTRTAMPSTSAAACCPATRTAKCGEWAPGRCA